MWAPKTIDVSKPLYLAVFEALEKDIRSGLLQPGEKLPTHRKLADMIGVTLGTATRIYREAERRGLVAGIVGRGTFVTVGACKRPGLIDAGKPHLVWDMGIAHPVNKPDPFLAAVSRKALQKRRQQTLMSYSDPQGLLEHRGIGSDWLSRFGLNIPPKNIVITAGAQHALFLACNCFFKAGDRIASDDLTFPGMKVAAQRNGLRLEGVPMDKEGMVPAELEALCNRQQIKGIYLSGRIQNPTNIFMSQERRVELCKIILRHNLLLIENDAHGCLSDSPHNILSSMHPEQSVFISSVSKAVLAGLRIAFAAVPEHLVSILAQGIADSMICVSPLCAEIATEAIQDRQINSIIQRKKTLIAKRVTMFRKIFADHEFNITDHSMSAWLLLPRSLKAAELEAEAARRNIKIFSSERFAVGSTPAPEAVRISLTGIEDLGQLRRALRTLENLVPKQL